MFALNLALGTPRGAALYTKAIARFQEKYEQIQNSDGTLKYGDKHFFADLRGASKGGKMDRTLEGVKRLVHAMRRHEVLSLIGSIEQCDELQTEYLLQAVHNILASESINYPTTPHIDGVFSTTPCLSKTEIMIAKRLFKTLRQSKDTDGSESSSSQSDSSSTTTSS